MNARSLFLKAGGLVFGYAADPVIAEVAWKIVVDGRFRARVVFNPKKLEIHKVRLKPTTPVLTMAHEFGHCVHSYYWPEATRDLPQHRAERLAIWCEARLAGLAANPLCTFDFWRAEKLEHLAKFGRGPYKPAARWVLENLDRYHPVEGLDIGHPAVLNRAKEVFHAA